MLGWVVLGREEYDFVNCRLLELYFIAKIVKNKKHQVSNVFKELPNFNGDLFESHFRKVFIFTAQLAAVN